MNNLPATQQLTPAQVIEAALVRGDLSKLDDEQRVMYYTSTCESLGLNKLTKPFEYITLNGKLTLYATKNCTEQLRDLHGVSIVDTQSKIERDLCIVTVKAANAKGRTDQSVGAVDIKGLAGEKLANAFMKAETKAKRRVTLSICGLGMLDESEVESLRQMGVARDVTPAKQPQALPGVKVADDVAPPKEHYYDITNYPLDKLPKLIKRLMEIGAKQVDDTSWITAKRIEHLDAYEIDPQTGAILNPEAQGA